MDDLNRAVKITGMAVKTTPQDHPDRAIRLSNLRNRLDRRFKRTDLMNDLNHAVKITDMTVEAIS